MIPRDTRGFEGLDDILKCRENRTFVQCTSAIASLTCGLDHGTLLPVLKFKWRRQINTKFVSGRISMPYVMVDIESDGPIPGDYSMICFGAVIVEPELNRTFYGKLKPISDKFIPDALAVSGFSREATMEFDDPQAVMESFRDWIKAECNGRSMFISDNNGFDWQFINWYFHHFLGNNPFGHSSTNLGSLYKGLAKDTFVNFKHLRKTRHTHHPVDDARGNAEALLAMKDKMGLKISFE